MGRARMIVSPDETKIVMAVARAGHPGPEGGWIDRPAVLRVWDVEAEVGEDLEVGDAVGLRLIPCNDGLFALQHGAGRTAPLVSIHRFSNPPQPICRIYRHTPSDRVSLEGDTEALRHLPSVIPLEFPFLLGVAPGEARLAKVAVSPRRADGENWPVMTPCPDGRTLILTTARFGGELLIYDRATERQIASIDLGGGGIETLRFRDGGRDLWVANHDQMHRIDTRSWTAVEAVRLRNDSSGSFVFDLSFDRAEVRCAVSYALRRAEPTPGYPQYPLAVPAGGRVLVFDVASFDVTHQAAMDSPAWLTDVALLSDNRVVGLTWDNSDVWQAALVATIHPLYPARDPSERVWM